jgi:hypothetical protein
MSLGHRGLPDYSPDPGRRAGRGVGQILQIQITGSASKFQLKAPWQVKLFELRKVDGHLRLRIYIGESEEADANSSSEDC